MLWIPSHLQKEDLVMEILPSYKNDQTVSWSTRPPPSIMAPCKEAIVKTTKHSAVSIDRHYNESTLMWHLRLWLIRATILAKNSPDTSWSKAINFRQCDKTHRIPEDIQGKGFGYCAFLCCRSSWGWRNEAYLQGVWVSNSISYGWFSLIEKLEKSTDMTRFQTRLITTSMLRPLRLEIFEVTSRGFTPSSMTGCVKKRNGIISPRWRQPLLEQIESQSFLPFRQKHSLTTLFVS